MSVIYDEDDAHQCVGGEEARDVADNIPASRIHIVTLSMLSLLWPLKLRQAFGKRL